MSQQDAIDNLATMFGRVSVRDGFSDGHVTVTTPSGVEHTINEGGRIIKTGFNFSINWSE